MEPDISFSHLKKIDGALGLHEIGDFINQLSYMKQHCETLLDTLNDKLKITYAKAPIGRQKKGQTYMLERGERPRDLCGERLLEKRIWERWTFKEVAIHGTPFFSDVCHFIQSYQVPLRGVLEDKNWGEIDLVGVTWKGLPVVIELKTENADDTPLRMLVEAVAYACAVRRAWNEGWLRADWTNAMNKNGLFHDEMEVLSKVPVILLAPSGFWKKRIGTPGKRSKNKVWDDAWPPFLELVRQCADRKLPIHFAQFEITDAAEKAEPKISNMRSVHLPHGD